ncbi:MAG: hypothetical protein IJ044_05915 [Oscillospiraceae bacterium]|nr:hypothetical protein [Oscillospiraceae bacterium]
MAKVDRDTLVQLATLYYLGDMSQEQLSQIMGISRTKVSRLLKQCREQKIVEFKINATDRIVGQLEEDLTKLLGLREAHIGPSAASPAESRRNVGGRAAQLLASSLRNNMMVGIAWGSTIREMVDQVVPAHLADNTGVIQLSGGFNLSSTDCNERELAKVLAMKLDARCHAFQAPILVQSPLLRSLFLKEPEINRHFQLFDKVDMAFLGVGSCDPYEGMMYKAGYLTVEETKQLIDMNAIGDLCGHRISPDGEHIKTFLDQRIIAIDPVRLKKIPRKVILAAGRNKAESIIAACRGGYADILVTDEIAAMTIQRMLRAN